MRHVAACATFLLYGHMLEDERPHGFGVAVSANRELACGRAELTSNKTAVRVVTVTALNQTDIDTVTVRPGEFSLLCCVTAIAQQSLLIF